MAREDILRARRLNLRAKLGTGKLEAVDVAAILAIWGEECFYCGTPLMYGQDGNGSFDHLVPYAMGGTNTKRNLVPSCIPCNNRKRDKWVHYDYRKKKLVFSYTKPPKKDW